MNKAQLRSIVTPHNFVLPEKDVKKRYKMKIRLSKWCNDWREYYLCIYVRYIMDSHHTNKTSQEEYKEQF